METHYWLFKSEPDTFSIDDLTIKPNRTDSWEGVRNYTARNLLRNSIQVGDLGFFYHSSCKNPGIVGIIEVTRAGYPDPTALNPKSKYYDSKSTIEKPRWYCVDVRFKEKFKEPIFLQALRNNPALKDFTLLKKGNRLSVLPVTEKEWNTILLMQT
ncbi:MAG TPA: EVE domain-containing protein [Gammaproteobacteria bacterium]|nr:EVE domain-containing protein [Gammaproteobacteria bacterium]